MLSAVRWLDANPFYRSFVLEGLFPRTPAELFQQSPLDSDSSDAELAWYSAYLVHYGEKLREYVRRAREVQRHVLLSQFGTARTLVDEIIRQTGFSLWSCEMLLALAEYDGGSKKRQDTLAGLKRHGCEPLALFMFDIASLRVDAAWAPSVFDSAVRDVVKSVKDDDFGAYINIHTRARYRATPRAVLRTLRWEATASLVDLYEAFVAYACSVAANERTTAPSVLQSAVKRLFTVTNDQRLASVLSLVGTPKSDEERPQTLSVTLNSLLARGETPDRIDERAAAGDLDSLDLIARLLARTPTAYQIFPQSGLMLRVITGFAAIMSMHPDSRSMQRVLEKLASDWRALPLAVWIEGILDRELSDNPLASSVSSRLSACCGSPVDPLRVRDVALSALPAMRDSIFHHFGDGPWICDNLAEAADPRRCDAERMLAILAVADDAAGALAATNALSASGGYYKARALRLHVRRLHDRDQQFEAARYIARMWFEDPAAREVLPVEAVASRVLRATQGECAEISRVVTLDLAARHTAEPFSTFRAVALEQFLRAWSVHRPSDLLVLKDSFPQPELIYLLRYVCVEHVFDGTTLFTNSREVIDERLSIVKALMELDAAGAADYQAEAKELLRRIAVRKRRRQLEQSKIYLELDSIRASSAKRVRDHFVRLRTIFQTGLDRLIMLVREGYGVAENDVGRPVAAVMVGVEETLRMIIEAVRDEFVASTDHGLDGYVSLRIRHGTLTNELRAPLEVQHLITTRDEGGSYEENTFWKERLDPQSIVEVDAALADFSGCMNAVISELKKDWLQVKRIPGDGGMFDFVVDDATVRRIREQVDGETQLDEMIAVIVQELFRILETSLSNIRRRIRDDAKVRVMRAFDTLDTRISTLHDPTLIDLRGAISVARTDVQRTFDRVAEWFRVSESAPSEPFTIDEAVSIAIEVLHLSQSLDVMTENAPDVLLRGDRFNAFVDIFIIVFQNIAAHSKFERPSAVVKFESGIDRLRIRVSNPVAKHVPTKVVRKKVSDIQERLTRSLHKADVAREGGTGFYKISNIFSHHLRIATPVLDFGFEESTFFVDMQFPWEVCTHESADRG